MEGKKFAVCFEVFIMDLVGRRKKCLYGTCCSVELTSRVESRVQIAEGSATSYKSCTRSRKSFKISVNL